MKPISRTLALWLSIIIFSSGILISFSYSFFLIDQEKERYSHRINEKADLLARELAISLWKYDISSMNHFSQMAMELGHITSIQVVDDASKLILSQGTPGDADLVTLHRPMIYQNKDLGSLAITFSTFDAGPIWFRTMLVAGILVLPALLLSLLVSLFILRHFLSVPIKDLLAYIQSISEGDYNCAFSLEGGLEMVAIGKAIQNLSLEVRLREERLQEKERELKGNLEKYKVLFSTIPMGITVTDPQGNILEFNPYSEMLLGLSREEHAKRTLGDTTCQLLRSDGTLAPPKEYTAVKALRENRIVADEELRYMRPDGSIFWLHITAVPIPLKDYGVIVIYSDITERKRLEEDLLAYKNMVSFSNDLMVLIDTEHKYRIVNATYAAYRNQYPGDFLGISIDEDHENTHHNGAEREDIDRCLQGEACRRQKWIEYPDRGRRYMDISYSPYMDRKIIKGVVVECRDITDIMQGKEERDTLRRQLFQAQKMEAIGTLAGGIAHDFNNILSSILGYTELTLQDVEPGSIVEERLKTVYAGGIRARDLVKQILVFARQSDEKVSPINVSSLAKEVLKLIRSSVPSTIDIKSDINSDSMVMGNATRIHQILMNLLTNAYQAMEEEGGIMELELCDVRIDSREATPINGMKPGEYIRITVSDTGQGIPPEIMDSIFEPYFTTKKAGSGTGMGLALTHSIIENYGGTIQVQSEPGQGSVFTFFLPIANVPERGIPLQTASLERGAERILFVDDEPAITSVAHDFLGMLGYTVSVTTSSLEALDLFAANPRAFDLVISDVTMPAMTGDKLSHRLLEIRPDIPIILCSGYSSKTLGRSASELGVKALLNKPITNDKMAATIRNVLDEQ